MQYGSAAEPRPQSGSQVPPGWYDDPWQQGAQRWWSGAEWTAGTRTRAEALDDALAASMPPPRQGARRSESTGPIGKAVFAGAVLIMIGLAIWGITAVVEVTDPNKTSSTTTAAATATAAPTTAAPSPAPAAPPPAPATEAPAAPAVPATINLHGTGGVKTDPFPLASGRYRVEYSYGSHTEHGFEMCNWMPVLQNAVDELSLEMLPSGQGAMKGTTNVYVRTPGDHYIDMGATMAQCEWRMTFTAAG